ncbi:hypothetical protein JB92DRAFT_1299130 [Gautieria morchelliformis]|nr:hypothetical protein JB92DRAFT_1299130 [Gautieria morchelliformis]
MKGETCIRGATLLSFVSLLLLIFMHVGQINVSTVPRGIAMVSVNMSAYGVGLAAATGDPTPGLFNTNASAPLEQQQGIRQSYAWGLYSHCAYEQSSHGTCSNGSFAKKFTPFDSILADVPSNYTVQTRFIVTSQNSTFSNTPFLETASRASFFLIFIGSLCTILAMISGIPKSAISFVAASVFAALGTILLLVAASIWTAIIKQMQSINNLTVQPGVALGIEVSFGTALWLLWASFAALTLSLLPYFLSHIQNPI